MSNEIKRMKYFNGLLLKEEDLTLDQNYHMRFQRLHNRYFHKWGIVEGLEVTAVKGYPQVTVSPGFALNRTMDPNTKDKISQEIWMCENHPDNPVDLSNHNVDQDIYITVTYKEDPWDTDPVKGGNEKIHLWERAQINHTITKPVDPSEEIILARVRLKDLGNGLKDIENVYLEENDGKTQLRTYAVTEGTSQEVQQISIGEKDKNYLPYISGPSEEEKKLAENDGLVVHSPYTVFYGSVISDTLKTNGDADINGTLSVKVNNSDALQIDSKGSVSMANSAKISGVLSATGGLNVSGENTTIDTTHVTMTGNILTVNKYTPEENETEPRKLSSGVEVFRGGEMPDAKFLWDENERTWKAGTDKRDSIPDSGLYRVAYGPDWDALHSGTANVDTLHKHSTIYDGSVNGVAALKADGNGNINVYKNLNVSGSVVTEKGIEVPRKDSNPSARLQWNEYDQRWQIGIGENLNNIPYGDTWDGLISGSNSDLQHMHSVLCNQDGDETVKVDLAGNVNVSSNLTIGRDLTVEGSLKVLNPVTEFHQVNQVVTENVVVVNKPVPDSGQQPVSEGGLEVYRGENLPNARIIWDEGSDSWKMGTGNNMSEIPSGIEWEYLTHGQVVDSLHRHGSLTMEDGTVIVSVDTDGNAEAEKNFNVKGNLTVDKNEIVTGDVDVKGSVKIDGDLTVTGTQRIVNQEIIEVDSNTIMVNRYSGQSQPVNNEGGLEVFRGGYVQNAKLLWNEEEEKWKIGTGDYMSDIPYGEDWDTLVKKKSADGLHTHGIMCDNIGNVVIDAGSTDNIILNKATKVAGGLNVDGEVNITGDLNVTGTVTSVEKTDLKVQDNSILLNIFEGDILPVNQSGLEIYRGASQPKARMVWDEAAAVWKIGIGDDLNELAYGPVWNKLVKYSNADALHTHGQLFNEKGSVLSLSTTAAGNIDVKHDLNVTQDLTVMGNLNIKGNVTTIKSTNIEIEGNSLTMNKGESGELKKGVSTLSVFRGIDERNAVLRWDEVNKVWKIGMSEFTWAQENSDEILVPSGNLTCFMVNNDGSIQAPYAKILEELSAKSAVVGSLTIQDGIQISRGVEQIPYIKWDEKTLQWKIGVAGANCISATSSGNVGIGNSAPKEKLDVYGNTNISGSLDVGGNSVITGTLTAGSTDIKGGLKVGGSVSIEKSNTDEVDAINIVRGTASDGSKLDNARIVWDEATDNWKFGYGENLVPLNIDNTIKPTKLYNKDGQAISIHTDINSNVGIGTETPGAKLEVSGDALITGTMNLNSSLKAGGKVTTKDCFEVARDLEKAGMLCWDAVREVWQAGAVDNLHDLCLDNHKHYGLFTPGGSPLVYVHNNGNVGVGVEVPNAKLEVAGNLKANSIIVSGGITANSLTSNTDLGCKNAFISSELTADRATITNSLTVGGNLTVNGEIVAINTTTLDVEDDIITLNKYEPRSEPIIKNAGIEIFRGGTAPNAQIIWNEADGVWQAGTTSQIQNISLSDHIHTELKAITDVMTVNNGMIGVGNASPSEMLDVAGNAKISGKLTAAEAGISGILTAGQTNVSGKLTAAEAGISGILTAGQTNVSGKLTAAEAGISGALTAGQTDVAGRLTAAEAGISGILTAGQTDVAGRLTAAEAGISGTLTAGQTDVSGKLKAAEAGVSGILTAGQTDVAGRLTAAEAGISGTLTAGQTDVAGRLTAASAGIAGLLTATDASVSGVLNVGQGLELTRQDTDKKAQILWDEDNDIWRAGTEDCMLGISLSDHFHDKLFAAKDTVAVTVNTDGNVGIGIAPETGIKLSVNGGIKANSFTGDVIATSLTQTSSRIFKENIAELPLKTAQDLLKKLNPVTFDYKNDCLKKHNIGFIAEDVPEIFTTSDCKSISVMDIVAVLTSVVKKQQTETSAIKKQLATLQKQVAELIGA